MAKFNSISKVDANQKVIVAELRALGASVLLTHSLKNCCDCVVTYRGFTFFMEIKDPSSQLFPKSFWESQEVNRQEYLTNTLTAGEAKFRDEVLARNGSYIIVYDKESARRAIGLGKERI